MATFFIPGRLLGSIKTATPGTTYPISPLQLAFPEKFPLITIVVFTQTLEVFVMWLFVFIVLFAFIVLFVFIVFIVLFVVFVIPLQKLEHSDVRLTWGHCKRVKLLGL